MTPKGICANCQDSWGMHDIKHARCYGAKCGKAERGATCLWKETYK